MNATHWDVARMAKTMGMKATITLDPNLITKRVKNSIKKQLRSGVITGGWQSEAAKIGERIVSTFELPVIRRSWRGMQIGAITMEHKRKIAEIVQADWAAYMLENPAFGNIKYYKDRYAETMDNLANKNSQDFFVSFYQETFNNQAHDVLTEALTPDDRAKIEQAVAALEGNEPIYITTYQ